MWDEEKEENLAKKRPSCDLSLPHRSESRIEIGCCFIHFDKDNSVMICNQIHQSEAIRLSPACLPAASCLLALQSSWLSPSVVETSTSNSIDWPLSILLQSNPRENQPQSTNLKQQSAILNH